MFERAPPVKSVANAPPRQRTASHIPTRGSAPVLPNIGNQTVQGLFATGTARAKLRVGGANDPEELEADRIADQVTSSRTACNCSLPADASCPACSAKAGGDIRRKTWSDANLGGGDAHHLSLGSGRPLGAADRGYFEPRLGADLDDVRVHTDRGAVSASESIGARAFTFGNHIAFGRNEYRPGSSEGRLLLAHELAHVLRQRDSFRGADPVVRRDVPQSPGTSEPESLTCEMEAISVCEADEAPAASAPEPGPRTVMFRGRLLAPRADYLRWLLGQIGNADGRDEMSWFVFDLETTTGQVDPVGAGMVSPGSEAAEGAYSSSDYEMLAEITPMMRAELDQLLLDYDAYGDLVRSAAAVRLQRNRHNLGLWREYVLTLAPAQVMGMALAQTERPVLMAFIHSHAQGPFDPMDIYERRAWSTSQWERQYLERLGTGQIHGGCQQCHEMRLADDFTRHSPTMGEAALPLAKRLPMHARLHTEATPPPEDIAWQGDERSAVPDWAFATFGDRAGTQAIAHSLNQIRDYLRPLGDEGYRIISTAMITGATDASELVNAVVAAIDERRSGYLKLVEEIQAPSYNFLEPLQTLQQLLPLADSDVRAVVEGELRRQQEEKEAEGIAQAILGVAALLLTVFPPTAPVGLALGAGLAAWGFASGYEDWQQGRRYQMGMGAGVFTREQEDAGRALEAMGLATMVLSAIDLVGLGVEGARLLRRPGSVVAGAGALDEVVGAEITSGGVRIRIDGLDGTKPTITITHPGGTIETLTVDQIEAATRRMPPGGGRVADEVAAGPANFMRNSDDFSRFSSRRADIDPAGHFDVVAHGTSTDIEVMTANGPVTVNQRVAARLIKQSPGYNGQPIRLLSCETGACDTGFAQNLANKMKTPVQAPTDLVWAYSNGDMVVAPRTSLNPKLPEFNLPDLARQGTFQTFYPKKTYP